LTYAHVITPEFHFDKITHITPLAYGTRIYLGAETIEVKEPFEDAHVTVHPYFPLRPVRDCDLSPSVSTGYLQAANAIDATVIAQQVFTVPTIPPRPVQQEPALGSM
jgi:hypothetical protein